MLSTFVIVSFSAIYVTGAIATFINAETENPIKRVAAALGWPVLAVVVIIYSQMVKVG